MDIVHICLVLAEDERLFETKQSSAERSACQRSGETSQNGHNMSDMRKTDRWGSLLKAFEQVHDPRLLLDVFHLLPLSLPP